MPIYVIKKDGSKQKYSEKKLMAGLKRAGANTATIDRIAKLVRKKLYNGISTTEVFKTAFRAFKQEQPVGSCSYDLKNSLLRLGKSGFPFEKFVALLLGDEGYVVKTNQILQGASVTHEIDVNATKGKDKLMVECKHFSKPWLGCGIQTTLYVYARFLELKPQFTRPMVVTNTRFSGQAQTYSAHVGMSILGWCCPKEESIEVLIRRNNAYPITMVCPPGKMLDRCLKKDIVMARQLERYSEQQMVNLFKISNPTAKKILKEITTLSSMK
jgi:hypothetical protein